MSKMSTRSWQQGIRSRRRRCLCVAAVLVATIFCGSDRFLLGLRTDVVCFVDEFVGWFLEAAEASRRNVVTGSMMVMGDLPSLGKTGYEGGRRGSKPNLACEKLPPDNTTGCPKRVMLKKLHLSTRASAQQRQTYKT
eukprot:TRINITY_DN30492_c0_g1_i3.p1 TRINITY_DN30492_c0_g1~~TRINITY_DN30492_c0_g1_i3.p1  ORF type:complete len:137 (-),score=13.32 TRINITY_DN30492_c0_g1_i3:125-535(-)